MHLYDKNRITYFAETDRRNKRVPFGIKAEDRTRHMYIIGKTGMGKSTAIENMAVQDIKNGEGFAFIDPHGKSAALLLEYIPPERVKDVIYFAPFDMENPISFNVMEDVGADKRHLVANGLMSAFKKIWGPETWSARMEYILMNALLALLEYPGSTLLGVSRVLTDKTYRKKVVDNIKDPSVKSYWVDEFAKYSEQYAKEAVPGIQNKLGQFTSNPLIRNIIGQAHSSFDLRKAMDERKILIVNLSKGQMGEGNANLLGGMIITKIYLAAMSRAELTEPELKKLPNFYMYVDEFQSFANEAFADILSEARKYKLALIMAHQYIEQMDEKVRAAVFGNVGTQIMFRVGATDAEVLEKEYAPVFTAEDMVNLGFTQIYLKLMIDGVASHPFSAVTMPPILPPEKSSKDDVIASSRQLYARSRTEVEKNIADWYITAENGAPRVPEETSREEARMPARQEVPPAQQRTSYSPTAQITRNGEDVRRPAPLKRDTMPPKEETKKPFAEAFKNIEKEIISKPSAPASVSPSPSVPLSVLAEKKMPSVMRPASSAIKTPPQKGTSVLKSALADVLKEHKEKKVEAPTAPQKEVEQKKKEDAPVEIKKEEPVILVRPVAEPQVQEKPPVEIPQEEKVREVPEDVLTAILQGED
ncbi:MAG: hypothetical protein A3B07_00370 [Candidatus Yonathbacteria bacterium RIFCSPLOWO2_01_FULL_43_27]|uniref:Type IV secretion system coupling protein TraD DNA-binding domain-containing protein n=1 Tax=Candidatus Yonathbacteria bacterium RIFCSPLOWO2_01_FULL_43_27 TaxID=1802726 RepID=A0A1G2SDY1_9BACT|nr:MAG: hypothetical protein A2658_00970 [Candidatus Yonathbacteria bacterium RIFCSPHIGHO2_01_FULL_44_19]OHA83210.1 MAG: hypothetical protein A3B07_00370 [Candidatus Yonathbacteria bacterium RIFCSPLOWO2_01_FULL_43_27]